MIKGEEKRRRRGRLEQGMSDRLVRRQRRTEEDGGGQVVKGEDSILGQQDTRRQMTLLKDSGRLNGSAEDKQLNKT